MIISGGLVAVGVFSGDGAAPETTAASDRNGALAPWSTGALNPPPAAPLDRSAGDDPNSPGFVPLLPSPTPAATTTSSGGSSQANQAAPTKTPLAGNAGSVASPTATKPPATATTAPPTLVPTAPPTQLPPTATTAPPTVVPTAPPTQPPPPTATTAPPPTATTSPPPPQSVSLDAMESAMFQSHNVVRANNGLPPLAIDGQLVNVARQRSETMAATNCFSHTACGPTAFDLLGGIGYFYQIAGENIARNNYPDADSVQVAMTGFINSPGHFNNIVHSSYTKVGIGVAFGSNGMKYFTVIFTGP